MDDLAGETVAPRSALARAGKRAAAGDADAAAFGEWCCGALPRLYRYLHALVGPADAADLAQQAILQALAVRDRYRARDVPFDAWLFRIARNLAVDRWRRRRDALSLDRLPESLEPQGGDDPQAIVLRGEALARLDALLGQLDHEKRELLALRFAGGLSAREIAAVVGKSEAAVKKQLTRTIQTLKEGYHAD